MDGTEGGLSEFLKMNKPESDEQGHRVTKKLKVVESDSGNDKGTWYAKSEKLY